MKHQNKAFMCFFLVAQRRRLHFLTASQRESEEMIKTGFYFTPGFLWDFHFNVAIMAALWLMLFVSFILLHSGEHLHCTTQVFRGLVLSKIHTPVFFGGYKGAFAGALFKMIASFLREWLLCPLNPCKTGMRRMALVFISHVNYLYQLLCRPLSGWRWEMSPQIMGTSRRHVVWASPAMRGGGSKIVTR